MQRLKGLPLALYAYPEPIQQLYLCWLGKYQVLALYTLWLPVYTAVQVFKKASKASHKTLIECWIEYTETIRDIGSKP